MQFFSFSAGDDVNPPLLSVSHGIWIFVIVAFPITAIALTLWIVSHSYDLSPLLRLRLPRKLPKKLPKKPQAHSRTIPAVKITPEVV